MREKTKHCNRQRVGEKWKEEIKKINYGIRG
jgi:hypothetical protein